MNILFIAREIPYPPNSGVRMRVWNVLKQLSHNHEIKLICYGKDSDTIPQEAKDACTDIILINPLQRAKGLALLLNVFLGLFSKFPYAVSSRFSQGMKDAIEKTVQDQNVDLIMCDSLYLARHIPFKKNKTVLNEHNIESVIIERYTKVETHFLKKLYASYELNRMKNFEKDIWAKFDQCYVCSEVDKSEIIKQTQHKNVVVIPNGVDVDQFQPQEVTRKPLSLVYTGLISWKPNEDAVLYFAKEIYPLIKQKIPNASFTVVGNGPCEAIQQLGKNDPSITVTGFVDAVKPYILETEVFIVPLRIGSGTRLKILEAWAMGKAIVSTSIGAEGLEYTDGKNIMIADTPQSFADKTIELLKNQALKSTLEQNGRKLAEQKYAWDVIGNTIKKEMDAI